MATPGAVELVHRRTGDVLFVEAGHVQHQGLHRNAGFVPIEPEHQLEETPAIGEKRVWEDGRLGPSFGIPGSGRCVAAGTDQGIDQRAICPVLVESHQDAVLPGLLAQLGDQCGRHRTESLRSLLASQRVAHASLPTATPP